MSNSCVHCFFKFSFITASVIALLLTTRRWLLIKSAMQEIWMKLRLSQMEFGSLLIWVGAFVGVCGSLQKGFKITTQSFSIKRRQGLQEYPSFFSCLLLVFLLCWPFIQKLKVPSLRSRQTPTVLLVVDMNFSVMMVGFFPFDVIPISVKKSQQSD